MIENGGSRIEDRGIRIIHQRIDQYPLSSTLDLLSSILHPRSSLPHPFFPRFFLSSCFVAGGGGGTRSSSGRGRLVLGAA